MSYTRISAISLAVTLLLMVGTGCDAQPPAGARPGGGGGPPPASVRVATAERLELAPTISVPGTVTSRFDARIAAEVTGSLDWVAEVGTEAAKGDVIARIDDTQLRLQKTEFEAGVQRESGRLLFLTREAERLETLLADNITARSVYERTVNDRDVSRSDLAIQRARLAQVNDQLARTEIRAPFAAIVAERLRQAGERVGVGEAVLRLTSPEDLEVVARAPLGSVPFLAEGSILQVARDADLVPGRIRSLVPFGDARSHLFEIRLDLPAEGTWKAGQAVRVAVPTDGRRQVIAVPRDALILRRDGAAVFRINEENIAERIPVTTGASDGLMIEIVGAVQAGNRIVIRGGERLRQGQTVNVLQ